MSQLPPRFCEQCGTQLAPGARFCETCGTPVESEVIQPAIPPSQSPARTRVLLRRYRVPLAAAVAIVLIGLSVVTGWWIMRKPPQPEVAAQSAESDVMTEGSNFIPKATETSDEPPSPQSENTPAAVPTTRFNERGFIEWVAKQDWFIALQKSMPEGVRVNFHVFEGEGDDSGWDMVELREYHSPDSGFDPDVSPMIGIFRISKDRTITEAMDMVDAGWISADAFMSGRSLGSDEEATGDPRPISPALAGADGVAGSVSTPEKSSPVRQAILDAVRDHVQTFHARAKLPDFLFVVEHLKTKGKAAAFQGYPVNPDGSPMDSAIGDTVFNCLLTEEDGQWLVVVDLTRSDVPSPEEVVRLRNGVPVGFPPEVLPDYWRNLLFP